MLDLSPSSGYFESIFICARLGTISLDILHGDESALHQWWPISSVVIASLISFGELALSALVLSVSQKLFRDSMRPWRTEDG
jgi:hypothetical protein